jgi:hypothetical protein
MTNSRAKGARGERELADALTLLGVTARRSVQYCGKGDDSGDLIVDGFTHHLECKRVEAFRISEWLDQATKDCKNRPFAIFARQTRQPWLVIQRLDDYAADSMAFNAARAHRLALISFGVPRA